MKKSVLILIMGTVVITFISSGMIMSAEKLTAVNSGSEIQAVQKQKTETPVKQEYTCPMHPEVIKDKAGKCPKCGMNLVLKEVKKDVYTCPMHSEVVQDKMGKCPKCGMNLVLKQPEKKVETIKK
jgi:uncharacterized paraquat-inducible protein A